MRFTSCTQCGHVANCRDHRSPTGRKKITAREIVRYFLGWRFLG
jgi:hypothetical protein